MNTEPEAGVAVRASREPCDWVVLQTLPHFTADVVEVTRPAPDLVTVTAWV